MAGLSSFIGGFGGSALGRVLVEVGLDTRALDRGLTEAKAKTEAGASGLSNAFKGAIVTGAVVAGAALVKFGATSIKAFDSLEAANLKLQNSLKNNPQLADVATASWDKQALAIQNLTGVQNTEIITGQAVLGQFNLTGKQVQQLIPLIVDLSTKMGIDMTAAAKAVGKATQGNTGILQRYGIMIQKSADGTVHFNDVTQGLSVVQGYAEAHGKTFAGQMEILGAQLKNVEQSAGKALVALGQHLMPVFKALIPILDLVAKNMTPILIALGGFAAYKFLPGLLMAIASGFEAIGATETALNVAMLSGAQGFAGMVAAAGPLAVGLGILAGALTDAYLAFGLIKGVVTGDWLSTGLYRVTGGVTDLNNALRGTALYHKTAATAVEDSTRALLGEKAGLGALSAAEKQDAANIKAQTQALKDERTAREALNNKNLALISSVRQLRADQAALNKMQDEGKTKGKAYGDQLVTVLQDQLAVNQANKDAAVTANTAHRNITQMIAMLVALGNQAHLSAGQVEALAAKILGLEAKGGVQISVAAGHLNKAAVGFHGMVYSPTTFLVGEAGPERVDVTPGNSSGGGPPSSGGGGLTININAPVLGIDDLERKIAVAADRRQLLRTG